MNPADLPDLREEYRRTGLAEADLVADPLRQFTIWMDRALAEGVRSPNAMTLATVDGAGRPRARTVLLKGVDARGFVWFTNFTSRKGRDLAANPAAALVLHWSTLGRQVCVTGAAEVIGEDEADAYFASRPRGSQISAWASQQSSQLGDRAELESSAAEVQARFADRPVPRPAHWGGYRLVPDTVEFWQGRPDRLHDRLCYERAGDGWRIVRLAP